MNTAVFLYYLAKLIIFTRSSRVPSIFSLEGVFKRNYLRENILPFPMFLLVLCFLEGYVPIFQGEALGILYNQTLFVGWGLEYLLI